MFSRFGGIEDMCAPLRNSQDFLSDEDIDALGRCVKIVRRRRYIRLGGRRNGREIMVECGYGE